MSTVLAGDHVHTEVQRRHRVHHNGRQMLSESVQFKVVRELQGGSECGQQQMWVGRSTFDLKLNAEWFRGLQTVAVALRAPIVRASSAAALRNAIWIERPSDRSVCALKPLIVHCEVLMEVFPFGRINFKEICLPFCRWERVLGVGLASIHWIKCTAVE